MAFLDAADPRVSWAMVQYDWGLRQDDGAHAPGAGGWAGFVDAAHALVRRIARLVRGSAERS